MIPSMFGVSRLQAVVCVIPPGLKDAAFMACIAAKHTKHEILSMDFNPHPTDPSASHNAPLHPRQNLSQRIHTGITRRCVAPSHATLHRDGGGFGNGRSSARSLLRKDVQLEYEPEGRSLRYSSPESGCFKRFAPVKYKFTDVNSQRTRGSKTKDFAVQSRRCVLRLYGGFEGTSAMSKVLASRSTRPSTGL